MENGEIAQRKAPDEIKPTPKAQDFEAATGEKSAQRIAQERGHAIIKNAKSWDELNTGLKKAGLRFEKKGSGAIIWAGETAVKASSVDHSFRMGKLVERLGEYAPGDYQEEAKVAAEPLLPVPPDLWQEYLKEKEVKAEEIAETRAARAKAWLNLRERQKAERETKLACMAKYGLPVLNIARHCLKLKQAVERRIAVTILRKRFPSSAKLLLKQWLAEHSIKFYPVRKQGMEQENTRHLPSPAIPASPQAQAFLKYAQSVNADRYRVTVIKIAEDGSKRVMILDKANGESKGFTPEELLAHIPEMLKLLKKGENLYYTPLSEDKHHILIDDVAPENVLKLQKDGYKPAAIIESSPGNFQCVLTFPKFGGNFDRQIANRLAAILNKKYGDPKLSGAIHPHRAPGFENRKPKHRQPNRLFPQVVLRWAKRQDCQKCAIEVRKIEQELERREAAKPKTHFEPQQSLLGSHSAYFAHYEDIRAHIAVQDLSRLDAMIALRMGANGHSEAEIEEAIRICAPAIREGLAKRRNWQRYAERTAA